MNSLTETEQTTFNERTLVFEYCEILDEKKRLEELGFVFEIHWRFCRVTKDHKTIVDYEYKHSFIPTQDRRDSIYRRHVIKAVKDTMAYIEKAKKLLV